MSIPLSGPPDENPNLASRLGPGFGNEFDVIKSPPPGGNGGTTTLQFSIKNPGAPSLTANVVFGTVMDLVPSGIATDFSLTDGATNTIYLDCTLDSAGTVTAVAMLVTTGSLPASTSTSAILLIGTVVTSGGAVTTINQSLYFSQGFSCCGRDTADPVTTPGTYEFFVR